MAMATVSRSVFRRLGNKVITLTVSSDTEQHDFIIHENFVRASSQFFRNALSGKWKESDERVISFPDEDPDVFEVYVQAIYTGNVKFSDETSIEEALVLWTKVYALAEKLMDSEVKLVATKKIYSKSKEISHRCPGFLSALDIAYSATPGRNKLCDLLIDIAVYHQEDDARPGMDTQAAYRTATSKLPRDFLEDLVTRITYKTK